MDLWPIFSCIVLGRYFLMFQHLDVILEYTQNILSISFSNLLKAKKIIVIVKKKKSNLVIGPFES